MSLESVVDEFPLFSEREEKERFLVILGLLASRSVSLGKAAEIMSMLVQHSRHCSRVLVSSTVTLMRKRQKRSSKPARAYLRSGVIERCHRQLSFASSGKT